jgi:hypothetical protein
MALGGQPAFQYGLEITQLRGRLLLTKIDRFAFGLQVLAHCRTRQLQVACNRADALAADQMTTPDFGNNFHG